MIDNINYIIKAYPSKWAFIDGKAIYFPESTREDVEKLVKSLSAWEWVHIESVEITKRDRHTEGVLKRCRLGSENERLNLQAYFNYQFLK